MPPTDTTAVILDRARRLGVLAGTIPADLPTDPRAGAAALVASGHLTQFQADALLTGTPDLRLGPYLLLRPLGEGGMGRVYLARHVDLGRQVAVKLLLDPAADQLARERFRREARAAAALDHPHIVRLYDIRNEGGTEFLVLEAVSGIDLQRQLQEGGPLTPGMAAGYIRQAAAGLAQAHERGIVHRDIKPANLMLTPDGTVKVLDLGLARSVTAADDALTGPGGDGGISGTVDYLSPEQAVNGPIDARTDVYGLGATLVALVTGRAPYSGTTTQKLLQHQLAPPPDLHRETGGRVPKGLSHLVTRMLAKRPDDRPASAAEVVRLLTPWVEAAGGAVPPAAAHAGGAGGPDAATVRLPLLGAVVSLPPVGRPPRRRWPRVLVGLAVGLAAVGLAVYQTRPLTATGEPGVGPPPDTHQTVYATDFRRMGGFDHATRGSQFVTADGLPALTEPGWAVQGVDDGGIGQFSARPGPAGGTLAVAAGGPVATVQWLFVPTAVRPDLILPGARYRVEIEFQADTAGELYIQEEEVWWRLAAVELPATDGTWRTATAVFIAPLRRACSLAVRPLHPNGQAVRFRRVRIDRLPDPPPDAPPVFAFAAADLGDVALMARHPEDTTSRAAPGWQFGSFETDGVAEFESGVEDGRRHLTIRNRAGGGGQAVRTAVGPPLKGGVPYRVTVEYRSATGATGCFDLREREVANWADGSLRVYLPPTNGRWETRHYELTPPRDWPPLLLLQNHTADPGNEFAVRRLTVTECPR